ncbi:hypothetical protein A2W24_01010 [Microgenomates group bacterium RBG_16_45_19]|nr:MAG: hypothetical protein A2W24_01010 [Microgenomates group bacterium RBG_16_45_19]
MGVLYGRYDLLDQLTTYKVRPAPKNPPSKFETGTGNFEGMCGVLGALEYIEWVGETFGAEQAERFAGDCAPRKLSKQERRLNCAVQKMREGPSESPYRWRLQTTVSCCGQKPWS